MFPDLPSTYVEHLTKPVGLEDVADANAAGEVGSMVGGLGVRVTLSYRSDADNGCLIRNVGGRAFGSAATIPALSWLAQAVRGQTWEEACKHTPESVLQALCDKRDDGLCLTAAVRRGTEFAVRALRQALGISHHGMPADLKAQGILVCRCIGVGDRKIRRAIIAGARDPESVGEACGAGTGCGSCRPDLLALIDEETRLPLRAPEPGLHPVERITLARGGPLLRSLGMPLRSACVGEDGVAVELGAPAPGAAISAPGAVAMLRHLLRETVCEEAEVSAAS